MLAARTPLRNRVDEWDARRDATEADCRTAARRSRGNDKRKDKSEDILLAPSEMPRLLRDRRTDGPNAPRAHCELSTRAPCEVHANYLGNGALSHTSRSRKPPKFNRHFTALILRYGGLYAFGEKTKGMRPANHLRRLELCTRHKKTGRASQQVNLPRRIPWLLNSPEITKA